MRDMPRKEVVVAYSRVCAGCGSSFATDIFRRTTCDECRQGKNPARDARRKFHNVSFVGVDGESVNRPDGSHDYVMLSVGDETLFHDGEVLHFTEIMDFLWQYHLAHPQDVMVGFFLGYDFTQWERLLPEDVARSLITTAGVEARKSNNRRNPYGNSIPSTTGVGRCVRISMCPLGSRQVAGTVRAITCSMKCPTMLDTFEKAKWHGWFLISPERTETPT